MNREEFLDRQAIQQVMEIYTIHGDRGRIAELAGAFAEDGILEFPGTRAEGRAQIVACLSAPGRKRDPRHTFTRHNLTSSLVELADDCATARTYFMVVTDIGLDHQGHYADRFVRTAEGWRIAYRQVRIDWQAATSLHPPFAASRRTLP